MILIPNLARYSVPIIPSFTDDMELNTPLAHSRYAEVAFPVTGIPQNTLSCLFATAVDISVSLSYNSLSLSYSGTATAYNTLEDKLSGSASTASWSDITSSGFTVLSASITVGDWDLLWFDYVAKTWSIPITVSVSARSGSGMTEERGDFYTGSTNTAAFGSALSGVSVTVEGQSVTLYENTSSWSGPFSAPTGSISVTVTDWLDWHP